MRQCVIQAVLLVIFLGNVWADAKFFIPIAAWLKQLRVGFDGDTLQKAQGERKVPSQDLRAVTSSFVGFMKNGTHSKFNVTESGNLEIACDGDCLTNLSCSSKLSKLRDADLVMQDRKGTTAWRFTVGGFESIREGSNRLVSFLAGNISSSHQSEVAEDPLASANTTNILELPQNPPFSVVEEPKDPYIMAPTSNTRTTPESVRAMLPTTILKLKQSFSICCSGSSHFKVELQSSATPGKTARVPCISPPVLVRKLSWREFDHTKQTQTIFFADEKADLVLDSESLMSAGKIFLQASASFGMAFSSTLGLLAPMVVARRFLAYMVYVMSDWYTGRYLRKKYEAWGQHYWKYYQIPAALRSLGRVFTSGLAVSIVGRFAEWSFIRVILKQSSCARNSDQCAVWCGIVWIGLVCIVLQAVGWYIETSKTPLRIQECSLLDRRRRQRKILFRPWSLLQLLRDPDSLIRAQALLQNRAPFLKPFTPNPFFFPSSWQLLRLIQMTGVANQVFASKESMHNIMRSLVLQEVLRSEWYRVLMKEKRVALAVVMVSMYVASTLALFFAIWEENWLSACLILPSLIAVLVSASMNVFVYFERRNKRDLSL